MKSTDFLFARVFHPDRSLVRKDNGMAVCILRDALYANKYWTQWTISPGGKTATESVFVVEGNLVKAVGEKSLVLDATQLSGWRTIADQEYPNGCPVMMLDLIEGEPFTLEYQGPWTWTDERGDRADGTWVIKITGALLNGMLRARQTYSEFTNVSGEEHHFDRLQDYDAALGYRGYKDFVAAADPQVHWNGVTCLPELLDQPLKGKS